jgi:hypothetical protein
MRSAFEGSRRAASAALEGGELFRASDATGEIRNDRTEWVKPRGNCIPSTTDFPFDEQPCENLQAFADAGREYGRYH